MPWIKTDPIAGGTKAMGPFHFCRSLQLGEAFDILQTLLSAEAGAGRIAHLLPIGGGGLARGFSENFTEVVGVGKAHQIGHQFHAVIPMEQQ